MAVLLTLMILIYPPLVHWSIHYDKLEYATYLLSLLLILPALMSIYQNRRISSGSGAVILLGVALLLFSRWQGINLMQLIPVAINGLLCGVFASSLMKGNTALITRIASIMHNGSMPVRVVAYTRKVTIVWALFFFLLAATNLLLAIFAPLEIWSLFANLLSYVLIACLFLAEYFFRCRYLGKWVDYSFADFIKGIIRLDYAQIFRGR